MAETENLDSVLSTAEIDAIGEIMNISMGSAATAISTMLDRQVLITTPMVEVQQFHDVSYASLEPAIMVKIEYVEGISGCNVMVFRQSDMQVIINLLMGIEDDPSPDFVFDEMSMSAACEIMNQMMGASATALSNFLGDSINISTPEAMVMDDVNTFEKTLGLSLEDQIVSISFELSIADIMTSEFISVMTCDLAKNLVSRLFNQLSPDEEEEVPAPPTPEPVPEPVPVQTAPPQVAVPPIPQAPVEAQPQVQPQQPQAQVPPQQPQAAPPPYTPPAAAYPPQTPVPYPTQVPPGYPPQMPPGYPAGGMQPPYYGGGYPPYGYYPAPQMMPPGGVIKQPETVNIQSPQFPSFVDHGKVSVVPTSTNMDLMMNVPLSVSVEIGKTKRKIKEIMDFGQGTVIELEKQAGAPVDIVVNGQLIARGDVVVVEDNFGVRITEILGTKDLVDSLENN